MQRHLAAAVRQGTLDGRWGGAARGPSQRASRAPRPGRACSALAPANTAQTAGARDPAHLPLPCRTQAPCTRAACPECRLTWISLQSLPACQPWCGSPVGPPRSALPASKSRGSGLPSAVMHRLSRLRGMRRSTAASASLSQRSVPSTLSSFRKGRRSSSACVCVWWEGGLRWWGGGGAGRERGRGCHVELCHCDVKWGSSGKTPLQTRMP